MAEWRLAPHHLPPQDSQKPQKTIIMELVIAKNTPTTNEIRTKNCKDENEKREKTTAAFRGRRQQLCAILWGEQMRSCTPMCGGFPFQWIHPIVQPLCANRIRPIRCGWWIT
ncbi:hypothetical protein BDV29DRAFT_182601 [Aspergillus leporis]|uniref:Uncharacterized protein n=1 Tax=Aspergillus leporis TaxID=41062 RepID=A0A5N5WR36_9EURO|nr:hypothetical protein BDV29DRAFT_182601 [Aspergillus leporis]